MRITYRKKNTYYHHLFFAKFDIFNTLRAENTLPFIISKKNTMARIRSRQDRKNNELQKQEFAKHRKNHSPENTPVRRKKLRAFW